MNWLQNWYWRRVRRRTRIPAKLWSSCVLETPVLHSLNRKELRRLRDLTSRFLHQKALTPAAEFEMTDRIRLQIAAQACLLVLNLGLDYFDGWQEIIVYPNTFVVQHEQVDESGVVHTSSRTLSGEAWGRGPVILSWADAQFDTRSPAAGANVVLHEFAHKLDMLNGAANGMPPLHSEMRLEDWTSAFESAFEDFRHRLANRHATLIDAYAAENPAEFFAVLSEVFFVAPDVLADRYPNVYKALQQFYRQDPLARRVY